MNIENITIEANRPARTAARRPQYSSYFGEGTLVAGYIFAEMAAIFFLGLSIAHFYVGGYLGVENYYPFYVTPLLVAPLLAALRFRNDGLYDMALLQRSSSAMSSIIKSMAIVFAGLVLLGFLAGIASAYSRIWFVSWAFGSTSLVLVMRGLLDYLLKQLSDHKIPISRIAIYGDLTAADRIQSELCKDDSGVEIVGVFSDAPINSTNREFSGNLQDLIQEGLETRIDRIVIAKESAAGFKLNKIMDALSILPSEVLVDPHFLGENVNLSSVTSVNQSRLLCVQQKPISDWGLLVKTIEDKLLATIALVLLSPVMALIAVGIKLDSPGPVFFRQRRHGYNSGVINVWKFRTMSANECTNEFKQAVKNDKRVTRFGSFLRKTSLDELPQLFNVMKSEMSIVGPRPHPVAMNSEFGAQLMRYDNRHKVKPGITGWAQINGYRGPTLKASQMRKRIEYDLEYIENWSLWFDLKIIFATPFLGFHSQKRILGGHENRQFHENANAQIYGK